MDLDTEPHEELLGGGQGRRNHGHSPSTRGAGWGQRVGGWKRPGVALGGVPGLQQWGGPPWKSGLPGSRALDGRPGAGGMRLQVQLLPRGRGWDTGLCIGTLCVFSQAH